VGEHRDQLSGSDAGVDQAVGQAVGALVELTVCEPPICADDGGAVGEQSGRAAEDGVQGDL